MKAKAAARFNGRQGGRFAEDGSGNLHGLLHQARLRELRKGPKATAEDKTGGQWPRASLVEWERIADTALARPEGVSPSQRDLMALDVMDAAKEGGWL